MKSMTEEEWSELYQRLSSIEEYFQNIFYTVTELHVYNAGNCEHALAVHSKEAQRGIMGLLEYFAELKETALIQLGGKHIKVESLDKPKLTIVEKEVTINEK